jgi:hypothetical protein
MGLGYPGFGIDLGQPGIRTPDPLVIQGEGDGITSRTGQQLTTQNGDFITHE